MQESIEETDIQFSERCVLSAMLQYTSDIEENLRGSELELALIEFDASFQKWAIGRENAMIGLIPFTPLVDLIMLNTLAGCDLFPEVNSHNVSWQLTSNVFVPWYSLRMTYVTHIDGYVHEHNFNCKDLQLVVTEISEMCKILGTARIKMVNVSGSFPLLQLGLTVFTVPVTQAPKMGKLDRMIAAFRMDYPDFPLLVVYSDFHKNRAIDESDSKLYACVLQSDVGVIAEKLAFIMDARVDTNRAIRDACRFVALMGELRNSKNTSYSIEYNE